MKHLSDRSCVPCRGDTPALTADEIRPLLEQLSGWEVVDNHHLEKTYRFEDFAQALAYVNEIGAIAEEEAHHPDLGLAWGRVEVKIWTHSIDGLGESDFILAAKIDRAFAG